MRMLLHFDIGIAEPTIRDFGIYIGRTYKLWAPFLSEFCAVIFLVLDGAAVEASGWERSLPEA